MKVRVEYKMKPNGVLPISMGWLGALQKIKITGGPFDAFEDFGDDRREKVFGVCVRAERAPQNADICLPIRDFQVPTPQQLPAVREALQAALSAALDGKDVYVGCMGGWGRTGLFLALLAKVAGAEDPVQFVRENYSMRAVETVEQHQYVKAFDARELNVWFVRACWFKRALNTMFWWL